MVKPYFASYWPYDCENVTIDDFHRQILIIHLNTSLSFNYFKLSLSYPEMSASQINETNINISSLIDSTKICKLINKDKYLLANQIRVEISVLCQFSTHIIANSSLTMDYNLNQTSNEIRLKFKVNQKYDINRLKVSICELRLFKYLENDCGEPDKPLNSVVSSDKKLAQFSCEDGYEIFPLRSSGYYVKCDVNSEWTDVFPVCLEKMYCDLPQNMTDSSPKILFNNNEFSVINGKNTTTSGTIASYSCENITINGTQTVLNPTSNPIRKCSKGKWVGPDFHCVLSINKYEIVIMDTKFINNIILISMGCLLLLCLVIILSFVVMFWWKRKENKTKSEVIIPRRQQTFANEIELWDNPNDSNRYDSFRMSHLTNDSHYEHLYEDVDKNFQRMSNNTIYESNPINMTNNNLQIQRSRSNSLWASNSSYC
jgi:hypothetical protein